ncbi:hypothetical protein [Roseovarius indicus]|uniref:hypothetical protein n=1 Tax=Roseovarius indicus TaxID=540747 RepID=UPI0040596737
MSFFLRLIEDSDRSNGLWDVCNAVRNGKEDPRCYEVNPESFEKVPGKPFAYWISEQIRDIFKIFPPFESDGRVVKQGLATADDFRFVRAWWETSLDEGCENWTLLAKGGAFAPFYSDVFLKVNWRHGGLEIKNNLNASGGVRSNVWMLKETEEHYFGRVGITWPLRTQRFGPRILPSSCIFGHKGPVLFDEFDRTDVLMAYLALFMSAAFNAFLSLQLNAADSTARSFEVGVLKRTILPPLDQSKLTQLSQLALDAWKMRRVTDWSNETSHAFTLPSALLASNKQASEHGSKLNLDEVTSEIDDIAFDLYGFSDADRAAALGSSGAVDEDEGVEDADDGDDDDGAEAVDQTDGLLSWAVGVAFGRFDWRLATGEREAPPEPDPFDPLPAKSPGMLPDGAEPFHAHSGILVDDQGHPNDLARLIEEVLARVEAPVPADVRRWLQRDFFPLHLKQYSKSRRKAPIYWPISTSSGSYTLWLYYPSLTDQTLFTAVNDFIEPKLKQVGQDVAALRSKGSARSRDDEKTFEALQTLELELIELRDTLLAIAQTYRPNHDDGVQITAAPLWQLFRHKPWQKILKDTWAKLEKGDYDWAHLAMSYWPDRVREKCKTDKSLAIAHDLEHLYVEPDPKPTKARGRKKASE